MPTGTTVNGAAFGSAYGGELSAWVTLGTGATETLTEAVAPTITSAASATANVGAAFSFTVSTTGEPAPALTETGALPSGITFVDNGNGTATLAGTATTGSGASYPLTITAANGAGTISQAFVLTTTEAPSITSPATATFTTTFLGTYAVTTTGYPAATLTEAGRCPPGSTFVDNGNGTGTISGTPPAGSAGSYPVTLSATNSSGSTVTLGLTITVNNAAAPTLTLPLAADFTSGLLGAVAVSATGNPTPKITATGALPAGMSFVDNGNGTALLSGLTNTTGTTVLRITASNGVSPDATQQLSVVVGQSPAISSAASASFVVGTASSFTVTTTGYPAPSLGETGTLPAGVGFTDNGNGTATISATSSVAIGQYGGITLTATNGTGTTTQSFTLNVVQPPVIATGGGSPAPVAPVAPPAALITGSTGPTTTAAPTAPNATSPVFTSASSVMATVGHKFSFNVTTSGYPCPEFAHSALPTGLTWASDGNGTATVSGVPAAQAAGASAVSLVASSFAGTSIQVLSITVQRPAGLGSGKPAAATVGHRYSFTVSAYGYPAPSIKETGKLPRGLSFARKGNGKATLSGTPAPGTAGARHLSVTVSNAMGKVTVHYTLTVGETPGFTSRSSAGAVDGKAFAFTVKTCGYPTPALSHTPLPGGLSWFSRGNGTATISGTATASALGVHVITIKAKNSWGTTRRRLEITVS